MRRQAFGCVDMNASLSVDNLCCFLICISANALNYCGSSSACYGLNAQCSLMCNAWCYIIVVWASCSWLSIGTRPRPIALGALIYILCSFLSGFDMPTGSHCVWSLYYSWIATTFCSLWTKWKFPMISVRRNEFEVLWSSLNTAMPETIGKLMDGLSMFSSRTGKSNTQLLVQMVGIRLYCHGSSICFN